MSNNRSFFLNLLSFQSFSVTDAFQQLERTARDLDRVMDRFVASNLPSTTRSSGWPTRLLWPFESSMIRSLPIERAADGTRLYTLRLHLPGFRADDVQVNLREHVLSIRARHSSEQCPPTSSAASTGNVAPTNGSDSKSSVAESSTGTGESGDVAASGSSRLIREYTYEHVLPNEVDVQKVNCKFQSDGTLLIQAPLVEAAEPDADAGKEIPIKRD